jgi:hypothetical protein
MGIPVCGGLHSVASEYLCLDCQHLELRRAEVLALERRNELLEEELELEYSGARRPRRQYTPPPPPAPEKRSPSGGVDVRPRSINTT